MYAIKFHSVKAISNKKKQNKKKQNKKKTKKKQNKKKNSNLAIEVLEKKKTLYMVYIFNYNLQL